MHIFLSLSLSLSLCACVQRIAEELVLLENHSVCVHVEQLHVRAERQRPETDRQRERERERELNRNDTRACVRVWVLSSSRFLIHGAKNSSRDRDCVYVSVCVCMCEFQGQTKLLQQKNY